MMTEPTHNITTERATDLLKDGRPLTDFYVDGELKIETSDTWDKEVVFENCIIEYFSGSVTKFDKPVRLKNCHFKMPICIHLFLRRTDNGQLHF
jgi:hypothetical protein